MQKSYINNFEEWKKEFSFYVPVQVRFSETDMYGHLNNTVPFVYFEHARIEFFNHLGLMQKWLESETDNIPVVADIQCDYVKQVFFEEKLKVYVKIATIGNSSIDLHYLGVNEQDEVCFTGRGTVVQMNPKTGKSVPLNIDQLKQVEV
ncbi:acyl-CoA thioesterase [Rummeliibacillus pycnus]|uniref:acyl-CoA thioesterase n=1 Tax=Rummeliibacillus pycnus TaxID=101070 RepID=UPI000C9D1E49|nr:thioesterase family protein [Rummeliibacillus pycnus]